MQAVIKIQRPDDVVVDLTLSATLGNWKRLQSQLTNDYPSWNLANIISVAIGKARAQFTEDEVVQ